MTLRFREERKALQDVERKTVLQFQEQRNRRKSFKCSAKDRSLSARISEEMTGISKETALETSVRDLKRKQRVLVRFLI
jgi:hypothetical protein